MIDLLLTNIIYSAIAAGFFLLAYLSNMLLSLQYNIKVLKGSFDKQRFIDGLIKMVSIAAGTILLIVAITGVPIFASMVGVPIPTEYIDIFNILVIITAFLTPTFKYCKEAFYKLDGILNAHFVGEVYDDKFEGEDGEDVYVYED